MRPRNALPGETVSVERLRELAASGLTCREIADAVGVTKQAVHSRAAAHGIVIRRTYGDRASVIEAVAARGGDYRELANMFGVTLNAARWSVKAHAPHLKDRLKIKVHGRIKPHTKDRIARARELASQGYSKSETARAIGMKETPFIMLMYRVAPDIKFRDGRKPRVNRDDEPMALCVAATNQNDGTPKLEINGEQT